MKPPQKKEIERLHYQFNKACFNEGRNQAIDDYEAYHKNFVEDLCIEHCMELEEVGEDWHKWIDEADICNHCEKVLKGGL